jgi:PDZ domain-containing protein
VALSFFDNSDVIDMPASRRRPRRLFGFGFLVVAAAGLLAVWVFPTPYVIEQPGPTFNVIGSSENQPIIEIEGASSYATKGNLDLLTVQIVGNRDQTPNWIQIFSAWLDPAKSVLPIDQVFPPSQTTEESKAESTAMMEQSQQEAIAAALNELGYKVPVNVYISSVTKDSPSSGQLIAADFVRTVDGTKIFTIEQLREKVNTYDGKQPIEVVVDRGGEIKSYSITPIKDETGAWRLGIMVGYKYEFPINVKLQLADVGGPSGGMMFALGIYDKLTPGALTGGKYISGTGTINAAGMVGPIGGVQQKMYGARSSGAEYFLAPAENCDEVIGHIPDGLTVFKVSNFDDALKAVTAVGEGSDTSSLATCSTK